jgi:hypothetical protein
MGVRCARHAECAACAAVCASTARMPRLCARLVCNDQAAAHLVSRVPHVAAAVRGRRLVAPLLLPRAPRARSLALRRSLRVSDHASANTRTRQHTRTPHTHAAPHAARAWSYSVVGRSMLVVVTHESIRRLTAAHDAQHSPVSTRVQASAHRRAHTRACPAPPGAQRTLLVVHVVLKVRRVTQQRSADACGVALAALDDAHRVVLAVAPAARQPRAHLQRYLAAAHLRVATQAKGAYSARAR